MREKIQHFFDPISKVKKHWPPHTLVAELVSLAADHSANVAQVVDRAIALFEDHVTAGTDGSDDALVEVVRSLLPAVTRLVAQHFNRTLVNRALDRVADGDRRSLADALAAADADRLEVVCRWP